MATNAEERSPWWCLGGVGTVSFLHHPLGTNVWWVSGLNPCWFMTNSVLKLIMLSVYKSYLVRLSSEDGHDRCPLCLGIKHVRQALTDKACINCICMLFAQRISKLARVCLHSASPQDLSVTGTHRVMPPTITWNRIVMNLWLLKWTHYSLILPWLRSRTGRTVLLWPQEIFSLTHIRKQESRRYWSFWPGPKVFLHLQSDSRALVAMMDAGTIRTKCRTLYLQMKPSDRMPAVHNCSVESLVISY